MFSTTQNQRDEERIMVEFCMTNNSFSSIDVLFNVKIKPLAVNSISVSINNAGTAGQTLMKKAPTLSA
jgi:hypothetical protein